MTRDPLVDLRVARLDIEQIEIDIHQLLVAQTLAEPAGGVETGMQSQFLATPENAGGECGLHHRLAARERDPALAGLEHLCVPADLMHRLRDAHRPAIAFVPGVRIVAILAAQQAAGQKPDEAQPRSVDGAAEYRRMDITDQFVVALLSYCLKVTVVDIEVGGAEFDRRRLFENELVNAALGQFVRGHDHIVPWKVRLMTSSCCSFVSFTKFTA